MRYLGGGVGRQTVRQRVSTDAGYMDIDETDSETEGSAFINPEEEDDESEDEEDEELDEEDSDLEEEDEDFGPEDGEDESGSDEPEDY